MVMPAKLEQAVPQPMPKKDFKAKATVVVVDYVQEAFAASMEMAAAGTTAARAMRKRPAYVRS